jgi:hypothetical protein
MRDAELLLKIGAAGGLIAVYGGAPDSPQSRFRVAVLDQTPTFLSDDEAGPAIRKDSGWLPTWDAVIQALGRYPWPNLSVIYVHPSVRSAVWDAVQAYAANASTPVRAVSLERWRRECSSTTESDESAQARRCES